MKLAGATQGLLLGSLAAAPTSAYFSHDGAVTDSTAPTCSGKEGEMVAAAMPIVVALARLAMANTDDALHRLWWGACTRDKVNGVYQQIVDYYPLNANFKCMDTLTGPCEGGGASAVTCPRARASSLPHHPQLSAVFI